MTNLKHHDLSKTVAKLLQKLEAEKGEALHSLFARKVVRVGENLATKSGPNLRAHGPQTLCYSIAANTTIPIPNVDGVRWEDGRVSAFVMDYMPGRRLDEVWHTLDRDQKLSLANELHSYISQLRRLKGDHIGAVDRGKAIIGQRVLVEGGPFVSEQMFNDIVRTAPDLLRHYAKYALMDNHEMSSHTLIWLPEISWSARAAR